MSLIKVFLFPNGPMPIRDASALVNGEALVPTFRQGPWAVRKSFASLLARIPGYQVLWATVSQPEFLQRKQSQAWDPTDAEVDAGVDFINDQCPADEAESDTFLSKA